jgi:uncharacterized coiled-coil protein SlyX
MTETTDIEQRISRLEKGFESLAINIVEMNKMLIQLKQQVHELRSLPVPDLRDDGGYI